jgi:hypothetical protein
MIFLYVRELQEESPMDNENHWKRVKETYKGSPILLYNLQISQGKRNHQRKRSIKEDN